MRYIRVTVDTELLVEDLASATGTQQTVTLVVDTAPVEFDNSAVVVCRCATHADAVLVQDALNASVV